MVPPREAQKLAAGGFDRELLVDVPDKFLNELLCSICQDVLRDGILTPCEHAFCRQCLEQALQLRSTCPNCRKVIKRKRDSDGLQPLPAMCRWEGCPQSAPGSLCRSDIVAHDGACDHNPNREAPCPQGCGQLFKQKALHRHLSEDCLQSEIPCPVVGCINGAVMRGELAAHVRETEGHVEWLLARLARLEAAPLVPSTSPLCRDGRAALEGTAEDVQSSAHGSDRSRLNDATAETPYEPGALLAAARSGCLDKMRRLLAEEGADPNHSSEHDAEMNSLLHLAVGGCGVAPCLRLVRMLISGGAAVDARNKVCPHPVHPSYRVHA
ncbi:hypothetical protein CYMTET_22027 [Cymbomonas tetramitiformis]|uniref:RING-type E3 ubiquitin transferase n=1 Tax=Cymbomonas tetramitiformis TaxID=36881 RepID=A0AAE0L2J8_9CHLO|nr:hypothetical protein CYMTET_22027 [Cymbomonas tetramitiformis]